MVSFVPGDHSGPMIGSRHDFACAPGNLHSGNEITPTTPKPNRSQSQCVGLSLSTVRTLCFSSLPTHEGPSQDLAALPAVTCQVFPACLPVLPKFVQGEQYNDPAQRKMPVAECASTGIAMDKGQRDQPSSKDDFCDLLPVVQAHAL